MGTDTSPTITSVHEATFVGRALAQAQDLMARFLAGPIAADLEGPRVPFAAVKLSAGDPSRLQSALALAELDWRDLLVVADFADDIHAHEKWARELVGS